MYKVSSQDLLLSHFLVSSNLDSKSALINPDGLLEITRNLETELNWLDIYQKSAYIALMIKLKKIFKNNNEISSVVLPLAFLKLNNIKLQQNSIQKIYDSIKSSNEVDTIANTIKSLEV